MELYKSLESLVLVIEAVAVMRREEILKEIKLTKALLLLKGLPKAA